MNLPIWFDDRFWRDLQEVERYYRTRGAHLPDAFEVAVKAALDHIQAFPEASIEFVGAIRRYRLSRYKFPYYVAYSLEADGILVVALIHTARSDEAWAKLLR